LHASQSQRAVRAAYCPKPDEKKLVQALIEGPRLMAETLALEPQIEELARDLAKSRDVLYLGRGIAIPIQLIAYHTAAIMGKDVDQPRNLAKSVTVE
jgi:glucosamine 6-phosphate synthetase-like amidotransferase/phosphosugar isomerase protein